jgi:hypothetical protein
MPGILSGWFHRLALGFWASGEKKIRFEHREIAPVVSAGKPKEVDFLM